MVIDVEFIEILIVVVSCLFLFVSAIKDRSACSPYVTFNLVWVLVGILLAIGDCHIYQPSVSAVLVILIGVIGFNLSIVFPRFTINGKRLLVKEGARVFLAERCRILATVLVICWIIVSSSSILMLASGSGLSDIRLNYYSAAGPLWMYYLKNYFLLPGTDAVIVASIISFIRQEKEARSLLVLSVILVLLRAISSGGRYVLINTLFMVLCALALFKALSNLSPKKKVVLFVLIFAFSLLVVVFTNSRTTVNTESMSLFEKLYFTVYSYFAGSVTYLSKVVSVFPQVEGSTFGACAIGGFITPIFAVLSFLKIMPYPAFMNVVGTYACTQLAIGPATFYNAMPTAFGYFFFDGSFIGVFFEALIFGYICNRTYRVAQSGNLLFVAFYIVIFVQICMISTRWFFFTPDSALVFFYLAFLFRLSGKDSCLQKQV